MAVYESVDGLSVDYTFKGWPEMTRLRALSSRPPCVCINLEGIVMKLLLRRDQKTISGLLSTSVVFVLEARAQLTEDEAENVRKYHMGKTILFTNYSSDIDKKSLIRDETLLIGAFRITIKSLMEGQHLETKDVTGLIEAERLLKEACKFFKLILDTAAQFGGEEIIEF